MVGGRTSDLFVMDVSYCIRGFSKVGHLIIHHAYCPPQLRQAPVIEVQLSAQPRLLLSPNSNVMVTRDATLFFAASVGAPGDGTEVVRAIRSRDDNSPGIIRH